MMALKFEDLRVLQTAESLADEIWHHVARWDDFSKNVVGKQLARAIDSDGANIAEAFGRFHYGEKLQFLYYARGSLYEAKYWLNRVHSRELMDKDEVEIYATKLTDLARQLNAFAKTIKIQRKGKKPPSRSVQENSPEYLVESTNVSTEIFSELEIQWLQSIPNTQSPLTNTQ